MKKETVLVIDDPMKIVDRVREMAADDAERERVLSPKPFRFRFYLQTCIPVLLLASGHVPRIKPHYAFRFE